MRFTRGVRYELRLSGLFAGFWHLGCARLRLGCHASGVLFHGNELRGDIYKAEAIKELWEKYSGRGFARSPSVLLRPRSCAQILEVEQGYR